MRRPGAVARPLSDELRWLLRVFALLALVAGILLFVLSEETESSFSWTIQPPLTAAFLGASYWAALVLFGWTARQRVWVRARPALPPVLSIAVLLLVATLIHFDRFHRDLFGWFWTVVYLAAPPALLVVVWRQLRVPGSDVVEKAPLPAPLRSLLAAQALAMASVGAALFVAPASADALWPWDLTPLTARAVGAFAFGFGLAALHAAWENDLLRFAGSAFAYSMLGALQLLAVIRYPDDMTGANLDTWIYVGFLASVLLTGLYGSLRALSLARARPSSSSAACWSA